MKSGRFEELKQPAHRTPIPPTAKPDEVAEPGRKVSGESLAVSEELGDIYFSCDAYSQAEGQYRQVLETGGGRLSPEGRAGIRLKVARCLFRQGRSREALEELDEATARLDDSADAPRALRGRVAAMYAFVHRQLGEYEVAARKCREAFQFLTDAEDEKELAEVELCLGTVCLRQGNLYEAERWYKKSLVRMSRQSSGEGMVKALNNLGLVYRNLGRWDRAVRYFQQGIEAAEKLGQYSTIAVCSSNLGLVHFFMGDWSRAAACFSRSLSVYRDIGDALGIVTASLAMGRIHTCLHQWDEARPLLEEALSLARERSMAREIAVGLEFLGDYYLERGELGAAETRYREGLRLAGGFAPRSDHMAQLHRRMGELELARGNPAGALPHLDEALLIAQEINDRRDEAIIHRILGEAYAARGDRERAKSYLNEAITKLRRLGERFELGKALLAAGMVLGERGAMGESEQRSAHVVLREAREIFQALGVRYLAARAHVELSRWENRWGSPGPRVPRRPGAPSPLPRSQKRLPLREAVAELERRSIVDALYEFGGNQSKAALVLGLTRKGLASKMRRYGVRLDELPD